ncbi:MAG TPA: 30S ribosomal protein S8 [bacterium]|nr:MAG: 30S ribosomal protein S8 [Parcubacteria group bacterium ADurb.Bin192]HPN14708.1 30S ribosomal protein S8 [bacterium]
MITDPISDFLTRIRNAQAAGHETVALPSSKIKFGMAKILEQEGYVSDVDVKQDGHKATLYLKLKYKDNQPLIKHIRRVSTPGQRVYKPKDALPRVLSDMGIAIISTSAGLMTNKQARKRHLGGEILCEVY